ncbi:MAG: phage portal protein, partial [Actinomycetota bacterium]|nr:phage portal protein [Actinomycetota bacterium]
MTRHKERFFTNGATPNLVVKVPSMKVEDFKKFKAESDSQYKGTENAYKTMYLGGGADVTVVGTNFQQMQFPELSSVSESRIAAASGVPPVVANLMAGLERSTYSNYSTARRLFADGTCHPTWLDLAGSFATLLPPPPGTRLHYDSSDVPMLREDAKDASEIAQTDATIMRSLVDAGFTPESVQRAALAAWDFGLLVHSGLYSVQLRPAGENEQPVNEPTEPDPSANGRALHLEAAHVAPR